ncbi:DNA cytosine methyltransferase [Duganella violaceipulchra]|uniref:DNA cytosine methyltransferase n=1 Tax=Duganella violaceipulchra TaxID=2849652 RepID=UPI0039F70CA8
MKRDFLTPQLDLGHELIIDNFAGGGGTSTGLEEAFGRPVDIAINHDPEALALHAMNHPLTKHLCESVWDVDPIKVTNNQPVGLVWLSPDCKHFSKAKGGTPVAKNIRGLAWVTLRWAAKCKPRVIMLENVEEFKTWGPLLVDAEGNFRPDPSKKGRTFESFLRQLRGHGYTVDHKEMRASDYDTPTIRKRFFLVARRDGLPIRWPVPTNGAPTSAGVLAGNLAPWRTAAECIDWTIPCPSIFERKRPLADATLRRIAKGIQRYVVDAETPFIIGQGGPIYSGKPVSADQPFGTLTTENHRALVVPSIVPVTHQGGDRSESVHEPFRTITSAQRGEKALAVATLVDAAHGEVSPSGVKRWGPGCKDISTPLGTVTASGGNAALVTAFLNEHANSSNQRTMPADEPLRTICAQVKGGHFSAVSATLVGVGGRAGESRPRGANEPAATITAKGDTAIATAFLAKHYTGVVGSDLEDPLGTVTSCDHHSLITTHIQRDMGRSVGHPADVPLATVTAGGGGKAALVSAHITKFRTGATGSDMNLPVPTITAGPKENPAGAPHALGIVTAHIEAMYSQKGDESRGQDAREPIKTVTASAQHAVMTSSLVKLRGTSSTASMDEPLHTVSAGGQHHAEVRAFLLAYYGTDQDQSPNSPLATVTSRDRFGLVTIQGVDYQIVDIGLRMLEPAELYRAQGFPAAYVIREIPDPKLLFKDGHQADGNPLDLPRVPLTKSAQVRMCGNSVCPPMARALIQANFMHEREMGTVAA